MADYEISYATRELSNTKDKLVSRISALQAAVSSWGAGGVPVSSAMNAATTLAEIAALSAQLEAQYQALELLESALNSTKKSP